MRKIVGALAAIALVSVASSTPEGREQARRKLARWNPFFFGLTILMLLIFFGPWR